MKVYATEDIRNVVLVGHGSVGKTMLTEAALFESGGSTRLGTIQDQNTVSDYDEDGRVVQLRRHPPRPGT